MQHLLSEDEYNSLVARAKECDRLKKQFEGRVTVHLTTKQLQQLCTKIADTMPVKWGWPGMPDPQPWGCKITAEKKAQAEGGDHEWYCDTCPVQRLCPHPNKAYSQ